MKKIFNQHHFFDDKSSKLSNPLSKKPIPNKPVANQVETHLRKLKIQSFLKWVSFGMTENNFRTSKSSLGVTLSYHIAQNPRFYRTKGALNCETVKKEASRVRIEAQTALLDYLHSTRGLPYVDAEHISRNSPRFLDFLLKEVQKTEKNVERSLTRFLRYHPINEFEPFFESIGLIPSEYSSYLSPDLIFLKDDQLLLYNYRALCTSGIARNTIGKIFMEANEVFRYDQGVLDSKMRSLQEVGLDQTFVAKVIALCPQLLVGDSVQTLSFLKIVEKLKSLGISLECIVEQLREEIPYSWCHSLELLCLFSKLGCNDEHLVGLLRKHPAILFEGAKSTTLPVIGFLLKFGASPDGLVSMFQQLSHIQFRKFLFNLRRCYLLFVEIGMDFQDIAKLLCTFPVLLGSFSVKNTRNLLRRLNTGKRRLCKIIKESPHELKSWVIGSRVKPLPPSPKEGILLKTKFLLDLGFVENSDEMNRVLRALNGNGGELQEKFVCLVDAGLNPKDIKKMLSSAPNFINQVKEVIEMKIENLRRLGYPVSAQVAFPSVLGYSIRRVKLRVSMYNWLKEQGIMRANLSLSSVAGSSNKRFITLHVNRHPKGPEVWEKLKKQVYSE